MSFIYLASDRDLPHFVFGTTTDASGTASQLQSILPKVRVYGFPLPQGTVDWQFLQTFRDTYTAYIYNDSFHNKLPIKFFPEVVDYILQQTSTNLFPAVILAPPLPSQLAQPQPQAPSPASTVATTATASTASTSTLCSLKQT